MKVEKVKKAFEPITITLENKKELFCLEGALSLARNATNHISTIEFCDNLSNALGELWIAEAMKNAKYETIKGSYKNDSEEN